MRRKLILPNQALSRCGLHKLLIYLLKMQFLNSPDSGNSAITPPDKYSDNQSHWVRDVTFNEDRSQVRCGNIPQVMVALRNTVIGLTRWAGDTNIAAACRRFAAQQY
jgi:hypothetical protein